MFHGPHGHASPPSQISTAASDHVHDNTQHGINGSGMGTNPTSRRAFKMCPHC